MRVCYGRDSVCVCVVYHRLDSASHKNFVVVAKHTNAAARSEVYRLPWSIRVDLKLMKVLFDLRLFDILRRFSNGKLTIESMGQLNLVNCSHKTFQLPHFDNNFQLLCDNWITLNYTKISMRAASIPWMVWVFVRLKQATQTAVMLVNNLCSNCSYKMIFPVPGYK